MTVARAFIGSLMRLSLLGDLMEQKYTAIWQKQNSHEREWIEEIFGPYIAEHVLDGRHELVMDNVIIFDAFVYCQDPAYYARFRGKNAYLFHFLDENYEGRYELYENFRGVFRSFWSSVFNRRYVMTVPLGYSVGTRPTGIMERASQRKYVWSFVGQLGKASRPDMAKALSRVEPHFLFATDNTRGITIQPVQRAFTPSEYYEFLTQSTFSPCPMGNVNLECYRVYEALECGSIPIVERRLSLDYFRDLLGIHPLPTVSSWTEAQSMIRQMLESPDELDALQGRCTEWWSAFKRKYSDGIGSFLTEHSLYNGGQRVEAMVSRRQKIPIWRVLELVRHHNLTALCRRVGRQAERLVKQGKIRVAHRPGAPIAKTSGPR
jgi:hypothetical protein